MLFVLLTAILTACGGGNSTDSIQPAIQEMLAGKFAAYKTANKLPDDSGILVHLQTPKGAWTAAAGFKADVNKNWHYRIASVSKTFTAASIMLLDQQGRLRIDDKLTDMIPGTTDPYLPDSDGFNIPFKSQTTIRQILSHRAGIYDIYNNPVPKTSVFPYRGRIYGDYVTEGDPNHQFTLDELIGVVAANQLYYTDAERDNGFHYSDTGFSVLAKIVERVSGKSYDRFIAENFLKPMGLAETSAPWSGYDTTIPAPFFTGYTRKDGVFFETVEYNMSDQVGPGNIISSPADMATWARTLLSGRGPLTKEQVKRMATEAEGNKSYGLGLGNTSVGVGHTGGHPGYVNLVAYNPDDDVAVVVVTPFIDYDKKLDDHMALLISVAQEARRIAGYPGTWEPRR
jgi:D-alanyl-D-alanine carboxypeptidase